MILRQAKNLKGRKNWKAVFIHQDLTFKQRATRQQLVKQMKQRMDAREKDLDIINDKIVTRRRVRTQT